MTNRAIYIQTSFPDEEFPYVLERAKSAFADRRFLLIQGKIPKDQRVPEDRELIREALTEAGYPPEKVKMPTNEEVQRWIEDVLLNHTSEIVEDTPRMRNYLKTRMFIESNGDKAAERIKALESLGKMSDFGMYSDRLEVSIENRTTAEIEQELNDRLGKYMGRAVEIKKPASDRRQSMILDLDKELGPDKPETDDGDDE